MARLISALVLAVLVLVSSVVIASAAKPKPVPSCNGVPASAGFCGFDKYGHWKFQ